MGRFMGSSRRVRTYAPAAFLLIVAAVASGSDTSRAASAPSYSYVQLAPLLDADIAYGEGMNSDGDMATFNELPPGSFYGGVYNGVTHSRACQLNYAGDVNTSDLVVGYARVKQGKYTLEQAATCQGSTQTILSSVDSTPVMHPP